MAFQFDDSNITEFRLIPRMDSAIGNPNAYQQYLESFKDLHARGEPDESMLELKEGDEPTYLIIHAELSQAQEMNYNKRNMSIQHAPGEDGKMQRKMSMNPNFATELFRYVLKDIKWSKDVPPAKQEPVRREKDGALTLELCQKFRRSGLISDVIQAYMNVNENRAGSSNQKNS